MSKPPRQLNIIFGMIGAIVGGFVGYLIFGWMIRQGFYALIIPGAFLGWAGGFCARGRSVPFAIVCGVAGLALELFTEWNFRPFVADKSLMFFLTHLQDLRPLTLVMLALGAIFSYRLALGRDESLARS